MKTKVLYLDLTTLKGSSLKLVRYGVIEQLLKMGYVKYAIPIQPYEAADNIILQSSSSSLKSIDFFFSGHPLNENLSILHTKNYDTFLFDAAKGIDMFLDAAKNLFP